MKNVYEVLRQKELQLAEVTKHVEALRIAAPLLTDEVPAQSAQIVPAVAPQPRVLQ